MLLLIQYTLIFASVLLLVALGGCFSEHSGVINIGLEGIMVIGALGGALAMKFMPADSPYFVIILTSILMAILLGVLFSLLLAVAAINLKADQTLVGTAMNLLGTAVATVAVKAMNTNISGGSDVSATIQYIEPRKAFIVNIPAFSVGVFLYVLAGLVVAIAVAAVVMMLVTKNRGKSAVTTEKGLLKVVGRMSVSSRVKLFVALGAVAVLLVLLGTSVIGLQSNFEFYWFMLLTVILLVVAYVLLYKTKFGLRLQACGEHPQAADSVGINVFKMRYAGVLISGLLGGLGGLVYITAGVSEWKFEYGVAGFGFLALAVMIFGQWKPARIAVAALIFGFFRSLGNVHNGLSAIVWFEEFMGRMLSNPEFKIPSNVYLMLPYIISLVVLALTSKKSRAPKAEGVPYDKGSR